MARKLRLGISLPSQLDPWQCRHHTQERIPIMLKGFMQPSPNKNERTGTSSILETHRANTAATTSPVTPPASVTVETAIPAMPAHPAETGSKLIVGPNIKLKGSEITDCEILVVEGRVEASMNSRDIRIAEGGIFSGKAEIDVAEIRGLFEGELTARKRLVVYATGKVTGTIRYGAMMVEEGGVIAGDVAALGAGSASATSSTKAAESVASASATSVDDAYSGPSLTRASANR
jgi:cytoskeletal protein CcmA (bactofilin family)